MKQPAQILHDGFRPEYYKEMTLDCANNLRLSKKETSLLLYYVSQANKFRPSLREVNKNTGIPENKISYYRNRLSKRGIIGFDGDFIIIDWFRIRTFAMIPRMSKEDALHGTFSPLPKKELPLNAQKLKEPDSIDWGIMKPKEPQKYTEQEERWIRTIGRMTEHEYEKTLNLIRRFPDAPKSNSYIVMYPKNENSDSPNVRVQRRTFDVQKFFQDNGFNLSKEELAEFDWRDPDQLERAMAPTLDEIRSFLAEEDNHDFIIGEF